MSIQFYREDLDHVFVITPSLAIGHDPDMEIWYFHLNWMWWEFGIMAY